MDVAKYIGLFLLKNHFCYIHGLGNLEIRKRTASFDGEVLQAPSYEVVMTPAGSIDDNLANFIATNEQISISKASNALRDFSTWAKAELNEGKEVAIPAMGKFTEVEGKIHFTTDPNLQYTPPGIPTIRSARRVEEAQSANTFVPPGAQPYQPQTQYDAPEENSGSGGQLNWGRIILVAVILGAIVAASIYAVQYMKQRDNKKIPENNANMPLTPPVSRDSIKAAPKDTALRVDSAVTPALTPATATEPDGDIKLENGMLKFRVVINTYENMAAADKRKKQLLGYGHKAEIIVEDSANTYFVVLPIKIAASDTAKLFDSLKNTLNPKEGIYIY